MSPEELSIIFQGINETSEVTKEIGDDVKGLSDEAKKAKGFDALKAGGDNLLNGLKNLAIGGVAVATTAIVGMGIASFDTANQLNTAQGKIQSQLGVTASEAEALGGVVKDVFSNNFGESVQDAQQAVVDVKSQLRGLKDDELQGVTEGALAIRDAFGAEVGETTNAVKALMDNFGVSADKALNMVAQGFQVGLNSSDDFIDSIREYSTQFKEGGADADQFFNVLASGLGTGVLGTDKAGDLFKEFVVRIQDGSDLTAESLKMIGLDSKTMLKELANGTKEPIDAFMEVQRAIKNTDNEAIQMQAGVGLLGTQFEDLGKEAVSAIDPLTDKWGENGDAINKLNKQYENIGTVLSGMWREVLIAFEPYMTQMIDLIQNNMPNFTAGLETATDVLDDMIEGVESLTEFYLEHKDVIDTIVIIIGSMVASLGLVLGAISLVTSVVGGLTTAWTILSIAFTASPIGWVVVAIGAVIAIGILLWKNWDMLVQKAKDFGAWIWDLVDKYKWFIAAVAPMITIGVLLWKNWDTIVSKARNMGGWIMRVGKDIKNGIGGAFRSIVGIARNSWNAIRSASRAGANGVIDGINGAIRGLNGLKIKIPDWVPRWGGKKWSPNIRQIRRLAKGGDFVTNGAELIMVGDNIGGKERVQVTPMSSRNINGNQEQTNGQGGGLTIGSIKIGSYMGTERDKRKVAEDLADSLELILRKRKLI